MVDGTKDGGVGGRTEGRVFGREEGVGKAVMRGWCRWCVRIVYGSRIRTCQGRKSADNV